VAEDRSTVEVAATVADYLAMLEHELPGEPYNKRDHNRRLQLLLNGRSHGAIEVKHQNISAVMIELGLPYVDGYKPRVNYQELLRTEGSLCPNGWRNITASQGTVSLETHLPSVRHHEADFSMTMPIFDFSHLSAEERIELAEQLWDSLESEAVAPSAEELELARRRRAELATDGDPGEPWERVLDEIAERGG